jgi:hypothetical protein
MPANVRLSMLLGLGGAAPRESIRAAGRAGVPAHFLVVGRRGDGRYAERVRVWRPGVSLRRIVFILVSGLAVMLAVVLLRVETTRLHYRISLCDQRCEEQRHELRALELHLARVRDPSAIRNRLLNLRVPESPAQPAGQSGNGR